METEDIKEVFNKEFSLISDKFKICEGTVEEMREEKSEYVWKPGVYVYLHPDGVLKVGRHLTNSRKRALEHITKKDNTGGVMHKYGADKETDLILFNLKDENDRHWAAAVEIYLEIKLSPLIKSKRMG